MREIKFRCWDKRTKQFTENAMISMGNKAPQRYFIPNVEMTLEEYMEIQKYLNDKFKTGPIGDTYNFIDISDWYASEAYEFSQFTGLTDKNGKEIYEGDILEDPNYPEDEWERSIVKYYDKYARFGLEFYSPWGGEGYTGAEQDIHRFVHGGCYVIGNIYQNPELI